METLTDTKLFRARLQVLELPLPWWLGVRGAFGFQTRCKFRTYTEAHDHVLKWLAAGWEAENISVSHSQDGPELWDLEWQINATRYRRQVEQGKLKPNAMALQVLQDQICRLYEEAFLLCEVRGWAVCHGTKERGLVRFVVTPKTHPQPLQGGEAQDFSQIWEKDRTAQMPEGLLRGDEIAADGRTGRVQGVIGSPVEGLSVLWDDGPGHPQNLWLKDVREIDVVNRVPRTFGWLEEAG